MIVLISLSKATFHFKLYHTEIQGTIQYVLYHLYGQGDHEYEVCITHRIPQALKQQKGETVHEELDTRIIIII